VFGATDVDFHKFFERLVECASCVGQFNHPGDDGATSWNNFEYNAAADERINLLEFNSPVAWDQFFLALSKGWKVSPTWNQDNHSANWGTANDNRTGLWLRNLDRQAVREAMLERRTFATQDKRAWIRLLAHDRCWMGSVLTGVSSLPFSVEANDTDNDTGFARLEVYGPNATLLNTHECGGAMACSAQFSAEVPASGTTFVLARAVMTNGRILVSAPVWATQQ